MEFLPRPGRIYVKLDAVEERKVGSLWVADKHSERSRLGTILAVGGNTRDLTTDGLKVGDRFVMSYHGGTVLDSPVLGFDASEGSDIYRIVTPYEILALIKE